MQIQIIYILDSKCQSLEYTDFLAQSYQSEWYTCVLIKYLLST
jgi:hypothetical protein